jgi:uncharacterized protein (DUF1800 family)
MDHEARIAAIRFGYGPRPGEAPPDGAAAWLAQLSAPPPEEPPALSLAEGYALWQLDQREPLPEGQPPRRNAPFTAEMRAWAGLCLAGPAPFRERMTALLANILTVSRRNGPNVQVALPDYIRTIRAHAGGRYADLLVAATRHPAMLFYLDQTSSIGPNSAAGRRSGRGLNENLARELLELHSVTPAAGYAQQDVTELARLLTGWSFDRERAAFVFRAGAHEPGQKRVLGRVFEEGEAAAIEAVRWLGSHPATLDHLARRLVVHFYADTPPPELIRPVAAALHDTGGSLAAAAAALLALPGAMTAPPAKIRPPQDFSIAVLRACNASGGDAPQQALGGMSALSQDLWNAPSPKGWGENWADWAGPEALLRRTEWAFGVAGRNARLDARAIAAELLGPLARAETVTAIARAGSTRDALALLLGSPEFQRR